MCNLNYDQIILLVHMEVIKIVTEYITLGQFLKFVGIIPSGAMAKQFLSTEKVYVNGEPENRRGKKLYASDVIKYNFKEYIVEK